MRSKNREVASRGSSRLSPSRKSKEPLPRRVVKVTIDVKVFDNEPATYENCVSVVGPSSAILFFSLRTCDLNVLI